MNAPLDRNAARDQMPWAFRYRLVVASLIGSGLLFVWALAAGQADAFGPISTYALGVVGVCVAGAVADDHSYRSAHYAPPRPRWRAPKPEDDADEAD